MATYNSGAHSMPHGLPSDPLDNDIGYDPSSATSDSKSPLGLNFFKNLNSDKKQTKDGQPPKRRGPKPDSKPALTRRQELNRQAQRTHRERKEMYIKALEQEVLRLKELFAETTRQRDEVHNENQRLKELLLQHGISYDFGSTPIKFQRETSGYGPSSSGSISGSYRGTSESTGFSPPAMHSQMAPPQALPAMQTGQVRNMAQLPGNRLDYDTIGIDFVLTLERPCMDHMQYLLVRSHNPDGQEMHHPMENADDSQHEHMSGHALMGSGAPWTHIKEKPTEKYPHQMPSDLSNDSLSKLLDLSARLPIDREGEITPIMAWTMIYTNDRIKELAKRDFERLKTSLATKVRCYGFGAVLEEFEVRDALGSVLAEKDIVPAMSTAMFVSQPVHAAVH
ncbi:Putative basic-leucine zipper domain-containing protein [Septoria linicola]|uniref:Basic-leucine zipper domain-containing protein n=1 Tax=Septoria linicola TaxID=215465 RepID=A0A9Q9EG83_9PEZI|nr:putative basic-leucine zipper domain-containing protein [Septoria linicola]USW48497.1 Putative basic-leucine zipper domain-containing protein [Septoria linicola]